VEALRADLFRLEQVLQAEIADIIKLSFENNLKAAAGLKPTPATTLYS
jgi:hypothetical protein